jgi:hypothetical protein
MLHNFPPKRRDLLKGCLGCGDCLRAPSTAYHRTLSCGGTEIAALIERLATENASCVLVLHTDGLIERRREDIDTGLARLAGSLARHQAADPATSARSRPAGPT